MSEDELSRLKNNFPEAWEEIQRLTNLVEDLQQQLKKALEGNEEQRQLLKDLQAKLDVLITQTKKRNKRDYGKKTEKHNPRPAIIQAPDKPAETRAINVKAVRTKHVFDNAENLPRETVVHAVKPDHSTCPHCLIETVFVSNLITHQLDMISASLKVLEHSQETRAFPKCKQYIVTAEKPCPPIPGSYATRDRG